MVTIASVLASVPSASICGPEQSERVYTQARTATASLQATKKYIPLRSFAHLRTSWPDHYTHPFCHSTPRLLPDPVPPTDRNPRLSPSLRVWSNHYTHFRHFTWKSKHVNWKRSPFPNQIVPSFKLKASRTNVGLLENWKNKGVALPNVSIISPNNKQMKRMIDRSTSFHDGYSDMLLMYIYIAHHFTSSSAPTQSRQGYYGRY